MKKFLFIALIISSFHSYSQCVRTKSFVTMVNAQVGTTDKAELFISMEASVFKSNPSVFVSIVGEAYQAKRLEYQSTTANIGLRLNKKFLGDTEKYRIIAFAGPKYMIRGREKPDNINKFIVEGGVGLMRMIGNFDNFDGWLRFNVSYNSVPGNMFVYTIGIQSHF